MTKSNKNVSTIISGVLSVIMLIVCAVLLVACGPKRDIIEVSSYAELVSALEGDKDTIKLTDNIVVEDVIKITREVELDLNGKTISNKVALWDDKTPGVNRWSIISVRANGDLTITGKGTVQALKDDVFAVDVMNGGKLTIQSGNFIGNVHCIYVYQGSAEIKGGEYSIQQIYGADKPYEFVLNLNDTNHKAGTASIVVTGGTFEKFNPADCKAEGDGTNFVVEGYTSGLQEGSKDIYEVIVAPQE